MTVELRPLTDDDLDLFFEFERDPVAVRMAAFTTADPDDRAAFDQHWQRILADPLVVNRTILADGAVVGSIASFVMEGDREVTYWVDRAHWGRGIASQALALLLTEVTERPLWGRAVEDNLGSLRVLERAGFTVVGDDVGHANGRGGDVRELILRLDS